MNIKTSQIKLGDISIDVYYKDIKYIHLSVHPPSGRVRMSSPRRISLDTLRIFSISKLSWIKKQQSRINKQERETQRDFSNRESHFFLGKRYLLNVIEGKITPEIRFNHNTLEMFIKPNTSREKREALINQWYRDELRKIIPPFIKKWEKIINVSVNEWKIKKMKTRWGTCNIKARRIWLNLELAKKPIDCIEYIVVHEMVHLLERKHNDRFKSLMDNFLPNWKLSRKELNKFPLSHSEWEY